MNWKLFFILLIIGIVLYVVWLFYSQRQVAYMSILLYKNGDADTYLKELDSPSSKFFFSKKLRTLMAIDALLMKGDDRAIEEQFKKADDYKLRGADHILVLQKELTYYTGKGNDEKAKAAYQKMHDIYDKDLTKKQKKNFEETLKEADYTYAIHMEHDGKYASELMEKAKSIKDDIPCGVTYYKAAQSYYLKDNKKMCQLALEKAEPKLRQTSYYKTLKQLIDTKDYSHILDVKL